MDYIYFEDDQERNLKAKRLFSTPIDASRAWDMETLEHYNLIEELWDLASHPYIDDNFVDEGLWNLFLQSSTIYKELLVEFLASFNIVEGPKDEDFNTRPCITFRLSQRWHKMSLIGFAKGMGIIDAHQDEDIYKSHLDKASTGTPPGFDMKTLWKRIGMPPYDPRSISESTLLKPVHRLAHRFLATTILFHHQQDLINPLQLKGLWYMLNPENRWNLPYALAMTFKRASEERFNVLPGGQFVTHMALHLGVLDSFAMYACKSIRPIIIGLPFYEEIMVLKRQAGDRFRLYNKGETREEEAHVDGSTSKGESGVELRRVSKQLDRLGWYLDDINRQNASNQNIALMPLWNERMGYFGEGSKKK